MSDIETAKIRHLVRAPMLFPLVIDISEARGIQGHPESNPVRETKI